VPAHTKPAPAAQSSFTSAIAIDASRQTIRIVIEIFQLAGTGGS
jgi:hypothetical protein